MQNIAGQVEFKLSRIEVRAGVTSVRVGGTWPFFSKYNITRNFVKFHKW